MKVFYEHIKFTKKIPACAGMTKVLKGIIRVIRLLRKIPACAGMTSRIGIKSHSKTKLRPSKTKPNHSKTIHRPSKTILRHSKKILRHSCVGRNLLTVLLLITVSQAIALPDIPSLSDCEDIIFNAGFQDDSDPSNGNGGNYPGSFTRTVMAGGSPKSYYISIPPNYDPNTPLPLLISWHGAAGAGTATNTAIATRNFWKPYADSQNFIIVAQTGNGAMGGGFTFPNDILLLDTILDDMLGAYNIEQKRIYGHGFSAGGHLMHTLMLFYHENRFAAYSVSAGNFADAQFEDANVPVNSDIIPVFVSVGNTDPMLNTIQSERIRFLNAGWSEGQDYWLDVFNGGHQLDAQIPQKSWDKLCTITRVN